MEKSKEISKLIRDLLHREPNNEMLKKLEDLINAEIQREKQEELDDDRPETSGDMQHSD